MQRAVVTRYRKQGVQTGKPEVRKVEFLMNQNGMSLGLLHGGNESYIEIKLNAEAVKAIASAANQQFSLADIETSVGNSAIADAVAQKQKGSV